MERLEHALKYVRYAKPHRGFVYVVKCHEFVKIGIAADVTARVINLQTGNPYDVELIAKASSENPELAEESLHEQLDRFRIRGEWFKIPPKELADLVASINSWNRP